MQRKNLFMNVEYPVEELSNDEKMWAAFCHLSAMLIFLLFGVGHIIGPLAVWLLKRLDSEYVDWHGREALNFQISISIYALISFLLVFAVVGVFLLVALFVFWFVVVIIAAIKANYGDKFEYPLCIRFL